MRSFFSTSRYLISKDNREDYESIESNHIPTLVLWGNEDNIVDYENYSILQEIIPSGRFYTVNNSSHSFIHTRIFEISEIIDRFIRD